MTGEKVLLARAKKGEIAAFESLMTAYENRIYTLALRSTARGLPYSRSVWKTARCTISACTAPTFFSFTAPFCRTR